MGFFNNLFGISERDKKMKELDKWLSDREAAEGVIHNRAMRIYEATGSPGDSWVNDTMMDVEDHFNLCKLMGELGSDNANTMGINYAESNIDNCLNVIHSGENGMFAEKALELKIKLEEFIHENKN